MAFKVFVLLALLGSAFGNGRRIIDDGPHAPQPYKFGYDIKDHEGSQYRHEVGDGNGGVVGSYGFTDYRGIYREVHYVADHNGFRATVKTNEPGTANQDPAAVNIISSPNPGHHPVRIASPPVHRSIPFAVPQVHQPIPITSPEVRHRVPIASTSVRPRFAVGASPVHYNPHVPLLRIRPPQSYI